MFRINVRVEYQGKQYTAEYWDGSTRRYQLRGGDNELVFAAESELSVVCG
jgi:hypothetical protein